MGSSVFYRHETNRNEDALMADKSSQQKYTRGTVSGGMDNTYRVGLGAPGGTEIVSRDGRPRAIYTDDKIFYEVF